MNSPDDMMQYAQPLLEDTDGSSEQTNLVFAIATTCSNLARLPEKEREDAVKELQQTFEMTDSQFETFKQQVIHPMIQRHHEMFTEVD